VKNGPRARICIDASGSATSLDRGAAGVIEIAFTRVRGDLEGASSHPAKAAL